MDQGLFILPLKDHKDTTLNVMCSITSRCSGKKSRANRLSLRLRPMEIELITRNKSGSVLLLVLRVHPQRYFNS